MNELTSVSNYWMMLLLQEQRKYLIDTLTRDRETLQSAIDDQADLEIRELYQKHQDTCVAILVMLEPDTLNKESV